MRKELLPLEMSFPGPPAFMKVLSSSSSHHGYQQKQVSVPFQHMVLSVLVSSRVLVGNVCRCRCCTTPYRLLHPVRLLRKFASCSARCLQRWYELWVRSDYPRCVNCTLCAHRCASLCSVRHVFLLCRFVYIFHLKTSARSRHRSSTVAKALHVYSFCIFESREEKRVSPR